jgi:hypothetical protein
MTRLVGAASSRDSSRLSAAKPLAGLLHAAAVLGLASACACARPADVPDTSAALRTTAGKPVAPIAITYRFAAPPAVGQPVGVEVTIRPRSTLGNAVIQLTGEPGLAVAAADAARQVPAITPDAPYRFTVSVTPQQAALLHLGVSVSGDIGGTRQARTITIPLRLGAAPPAGKTPAPNLKVAPSGDVVHSLPAQERVDRQRR